MKKLRYLFLSLLVVLVLAFLGGAGFLYYQIVLAPAPEMAEEHISEILGRESPVFYSDGVTQFGVLFEDIHRQYIKYEDIPKAFVNALIAAEDDQYFSHFGVDVPGIARALFVNYKAGKIVQGGSTITQQTAKNLFKRESRSIPAKIKELLQAFRLEHRYSKEKILEFYCNQFYVSGNGHGLGVAARYFFDKEPAELSLVEAAFIAGSVKRPNYYNPFLQKNREDPIETKKRAMERVRYVLQQMLSERMITQDEFLAARTTEIEFKQGKMSYEQNATMDLVKEGVSSPILAEYLEENGISNISTSGARIITTIDKELQHKTVAALRSQLSQLDVVLRGYTRSEVQQEYAELSYSGDEDIAPGAFVFGTFTGADAANGLSGVQLAGERRAYIATDGFDNLAGSLAIHRQGPWAKAAAAHKNALRAQLQPGDKIYASVRETPGPGGELLLDLERYPKVEGGAIVLKQGAIKAISGGMSNVHFNRATSARRLMGSAFKPFLYAAALQLGWSPVDMLNNRRNVFVFMDQPYFPRPDHASPFTEVTLSWAGVTSENLATVWLLYHLTDRLEFPALREIAQQVGMAPKAEGNSQESYEQYKKRMQSEFGLWVSKGMVDQAAYDAAVRSLKTDFLFAGNQQEYDRLTRLPYGYNYNKYAGVVRANRSGDKPADVQRNAGLLFPSFLGIRARLPQMVAYRQYVHSYKPLVDPDMAFDNPEFAAAISESERGLRQSDGGAQGALYRTGTGTVIFSLRNDVPEGWLAISPRDLQTQFTIMGAAEEHAFWQRVLLEGVLSAESLAQVEQRMQEESKRFDINRAYSLDVLSELRDFRVMLNLQYLIHLARACGVESTIEPVLSLPLGSNVVTLSELARVYEAIITGNRYDPADGEVMGRLEGESRVDRDGPSLIGRIVTPEGREVYNRKAYATRIFDGRTSAAIGSILQNTVAYGTGKYAADNVALHSSDPDKEKKLAQIKRALPLMGKTGTANEYRNAAFLGYVPVLSQDDPSVLSLEDGYTVGVYTGYDINLPMVQGAARIGGSRGALPAWSAIAQALIDFEQIGDKVDMADLQFNTGLPLRYPEVEQTFLPVDPKQGGAVVRGKAGLRQQAAPPFPASLDVGEQDKGVFEPERNFAPFWRTQEAN